MSYDNEKEYSDPPYLGGGAMQALDVPAKSPRALPIRKRLEIQIQSHKEQIARMEEMIKLLDDNPGIEKFQDLSARMRF